MLKLLKNSRKVTKIALMVIILNIGVQTIVNGNSTVTANWGDVVDVNYSLWRDVEHTIEVPGNIGIDLSYIYLSNTTTVPQDILAQFPETTAAIIQSFKEALIDMAENEVKDFKINSEDAYNDGDLYYRVILLRIRYDQSSENTSIQTTVHPSETTIITSSQPETSSLITTTTTTTATTESIIPELTSGSSIFISMLVLLSVVLLRRKKITSKDKY